MLLSRRKETAPQEHCKEACGGLQTTLGTIPFLREKTHGRERCRHIHQG